MSQAPTQPERLFFNCPACNQTLSLERHLSGITGPCPVCGSPVTAPILPPVRSEESSTRSESIRKTHTRRSKGRIIADSAIDHGHLERRETVKTLRIFLLFILAFCACLLVTWFMKDWIRR